MLLLVQKNVGVEMGTGASRLNHITPILQEFALAPNNLSCPIQSAGIGLKALYISGPAYLKDCLFHYYLIRKLHFTKKALLCVPPVSEAWLVGSRGRAYSVAAPPLCNFLSRIPHEAAFTGISMPCENKAVQAGF